LRTDRLRFHRIAGLEPLIEGACFAGRHGEAAFFRQGTDRNQQLAHDFSFA
jgi:hypothetical protein